MKRRTLFILLAAALPLYSCGQVQLYSPVSTAKNGSLTAVAYDWEVIGINPANLGWDDNHKLSFTILDAGLSGQCNGMNISMLASALYSPSLGVRSNSWQQILGNGLISFGDINWAAVSFRVPGIPGGFALNLRDRLSGTAIMGPEGVIALANSGNQLYDDAQMLSFLQGTHVQFTHYRELNLDYGSKLINFGGGGTDNSPNLARCFSFTGKGNTDYALFGGIGLKYLIGLANITGFVDNTGINATYAVEKNYPNFSPTFPVAPGQGFAFDLGLGASYERWKFGLSITDVGSITWKHGYELTADTAVAQIKHGSDFINALSDGTLTGSKPAPDYVEDLPAKLRAAACYRVNDIVSVSYDLVIRLNNAPDNLIGPYFAIGVLIKANKYLDISTGLAGTDGYGIAAPIGLTFNATRNIQFYLGTTDIASYLHMRNNANLSLALCSFRYNL